MKNNSTPIPDSHKKPKPKQTGTLNIKSSNNFSEKYLQFTKDKLFTSTPKKSHHVTRDVISPRDSKDWKN